WSLSPARVRISFAMTERRSLPALQARWYDHAGGHHGNSRPGERDEAARALPDPVRREVRGLERRLLCRSDLWTARALRRVRRDSGRFQPLEGDSRNLGAAKAGVHRATAAARPRQGSPVSTRLLRMTGSPLQSLHDYSELVAALLARLRRLHRRPLCIPKETS